MVLASFTPDQVERDELLGHLGRLVAASGAQVQSSRNTSEGTFELTVKVPIGKETSSDVDAITKLSVAGALS